MFCFQCEQTAKNQGCEKVGVCGKKPDVAALQDLLVYMLKGLGVVATEGRKVGVKEKDVDVFALEALFSTLTNVDFDPDRFVELIQRTYDLREALKEKVKESGGTIDESLEAVTLKPADTKDGMVAQGEKYNIKADLSLGEDILALRETLIYGLKGVAAYADHAQILGKEDDRIYAFVHEALAKTLDKNLTVEDYLGLVLKCGEVNYITMEILDDANTSTYGHPVPTKVPLGHKKGKAILVSGHDLKDMELILKQTEGKGIYVYTHGEMLPCHGYPELKKYEHFYGHYGTAWQNQKKEFAQFPGAIIMTTNCIQEPADNYKNNIFTTGLVGWPGVTHIEDKDFSPAIERALELPGFEEDLDAGYVMAGFARNAVMGVADKVIEAVKNKQIRHFFLVGGCDGARPSRNYYTEIVEKIPEDCVVLTLGCGKFKFFNKDLGDIGGIPRLLDIGQCNDAYSAIQIALALSKAFNCGVNDLPLSLIISWYEQKAVAILLTLLHLGIKDIRLGPTLPAFIGISKNVLNVLVEQFGLKPISTPDEDLKAILG